MRMACRRRRDASLLRLAVSWCLLLLVHHTTGSCFFFLFAVAVACGGCLRAGGADFCSSSSSSTCSSSWSLITSSSMVPTISSSSPTFVITSFIRFYLLVAVVSSSSLRLLSSAGLLRLACLGVVCLLGVADEPPLPFRCGLAADASLLDGVGWICWIGCWLGGRVGRAAANGWTRFVVGHAGCSMCASVWRGGQTDDR